MKSYSPVCPKRQKKLLAIKSWKTTPAVRNSEYKQLREVKFPSIPRIRAVVIWRDKILGKPGDPGAAI
jgi:hypothetical protein